MSDHYWPHLFDCVICQRNIHDMRERRGPDKEVAPICRWCEREYGDRAPGAGAFMDRRRARQISALGNALHSKAGIMQWEAKYARA